MAMIKRHTTALVMVPVPGALELVEDRLTDRLMVMIEVPPHVLHPPGLLLNESVPVIEPTKGPAVVVSTTESVGLPATGAPIASV